MRDEIPLIDRAIALTNGFSVLLVQTNSPLGLAQNLKTEVLARSFCVESAPDLLIEMVCDRATMPTLLFAEEPAAWTHLLNRLNERRQHLIRNHPYPLIFAGVQENISNLLSRLAPDIWSLRSLNVEVTIPEIELPASPVACYNPKAD